MRKAFLIVLAAAGLVMVSGVLVFHFARGLSWVDSVYFSVTTMTTVGYGDFNLRDAGPGMKLFGVLLMVAGPASVAAMFGIVTDLVLRAHLDRLFGAKVGRMKNHIVLCGLGRVGVRALQRLTMIGEQVVVVEQNEDARFIDEARDRSVPVVNGDMRQSATLSRANIAEAKSIVACCNQDLVNLETALNARELNPNIRVVLRIFDPTLAQRIETGFGFETAFSTSALSAPAFAMAAVDSSVVGSLFVEDELMLNLRIEVNRNSQLDGLSSSELRKLGRLSLLSHRSKATGEHLLHPSEKLTLGAGDTLVLCAPPDLRIPLEEMNQPG